MSVCLSFNCDALFQLLQLLIRSIKELKAKNKSISSPKRARRAEPNIYRDKILTIRKNAVKFYKHKICCCFYGKFPLFGQILLGYHINFKVNSTIAWPDPSGIVYSRSQELQLTWHKVYSHMHNTTLLFRLFTPGSDYRRSTLP